MTSTGGNSAPFSLVMSPTWTISGNRTFVTRMGNASISLAHKVWMPTRCAAKGKPPIPSNKLPIVRLISYHLPITWIFQRKPSAFLSIPLGMRIARGGSPPAGLPEHFGLKFRDPASAISSTNTI